MRLSAALWTAIWLASTGLACASPPSKPIEEWVASARSPADHWKIVEYYRGEAVEAHRRSAEHTRLADVYGGPHRWGSAFAERAREHCKGLAAAEDEMAARYELLAAEHERLAQE